MWCGLQCEPWAGLVCEDWAVFCHLESWKSSPCTGYHSLAAIKSESHKEAKCSLTFGQGEEEPVLHRSFLEWVIEDRKEINLGRPAFGHLDMWNELYR